MKLRHLAAVPTAQPTLLTRPSPRKLFWRAFLDWLAVAPGDEAEQLERVLCSHSHHVRPLIDAVTDALHSPQDAPRLPPALLATLDASGWKPAPLPVPVPEPTRSAA